MTCYQGDGLHTFKVIHSLLYWGDEETKNKHTMNTGQEQSACTSGEVHATMMSSVTGQDDERVHWVGQLEVDEGTTLYTTSWMRNRKMYSLQSRSNECADTEKLMMVKIKAK